MPRVPKSAPPSVESDLIASYFLGPKAQNAALWQEMLRRVYDDYVHWRRNYFPGDETIITSSDQRHPYQLKWLDTLSTHLDGVLDDLKADYPFYSPRYIAHMTSDLSLPGVLGLFAGMLYNPNNVSPEGGPVSVKRELAVGDLLADMLGFVPADGPDSRAWGHLTSGGTIATLEALWVARQAQFIPLIVADCCKNASVRAGVLQTLADRGRNLSSPAETIIRSTETWEAYITDRLGDAAHSAHSLLATAPSRRLAMLPELRRFLSARLPSTLDEATGMAAALDLTDYLLAAVHESAYNPARQGYASVMVKLAEEGIRRGVVFAPETAHYCVSKACNVLGYGSAALESVGLDDRFRMRIDALRDGIESLAEDEYIAAVVAVVGTTEEGAVDPLHDIVRLRAETGQFWLHADAAWGGYIACTFDRDEEGQFARTAHGSLRVRHSGSTDHGLSAPMWCREADRAQDPALEPIEWGRTGGPQEHVKAAYGALRDADSVVIDPHKLGYIPYPCGAVLFRDRRTTLMTAQSPSYIGAGRQTGEDVLAPGGVAHLKSVGNYIVEGSKPGAAAMAAWLAHKTIPLRPDGHGRIIEDTLIAAQKLARLLRLIDSDASFSRRCEERAMARSPSAHQRHAYRIGFRLVADPDTNVVTFVARPLRLVVADGRESLKPVPWDLDEVDALNQRIHAYMGQPRRTEEVTARPELDAAFPYSHAFFVSRTRMVSTAQPDGTYSFGSVRSLLGDLLPPDGDHQTTYDGNSTGLTAIRCAVMSPYYGLAERRGEDFIVDFAMTLYKVGLDALRQFTEKLASYVLVTCEPGSATAVANAVRAQRGHYRRAVVVDGEPPFDQQMVLIEVRAPVGDEVDATNEVRRLGLDHNVYGVEATETFLRTEGDMAGVPPADGRDPIVYVFVKVDVPHTLDVLRKVLATKIPRGALEVRVITGRYDLAVAVSGMTATDAGRIVAKVGKLQYVKATSALWAHGRR